MPFKRVKIYLISSCLIFGFMGCAENIVTVNKKFDFSKVHRIAVLGFESVEGMKESGPVMAAVFEKLLIEGGHELIERQQVNKIVGEQNFQLSGAVNPKQAIKLGEILGVDALVFGSVTVYAPHQTSVIMVDVHSETKEPIMAKKKIEFVNKDGKKEFQDVDVVLDYKVTDQVRQEPQIYRIQAEAGAVVKMVDTTTGEIAWVGSATEEGSNIQVASEYLGQRIVKSLKKFWKVPPKGA